jgi:hypothetical protein
MNKSLDIKEAYIQPLLCNDVIFKSLFIGNEFVLEKFIYDITGDKVKDIKLFANEIPIKRDNEKFKRCDFLIKHNNTIYNIELNNSYYDALLIKNTSYIFSLYSTDASRGDEYNKDLNVIQININNYTRYNKPVLDYKIINDNYSYIYLDSLKIYELDIVKCNKLYYNDRIRKRRYLKWGALFSCTNIKDMEPILDELLTKKEKDIIMENLNKILKEDYIMSEAEALRLDDMLRRSIRKEGLEEGRKEGRKEDRSQGPRRFRRRQSRRKGRQKSRPRR